ncbi:MAG: TetR/AcrR family transcriptional regulator [Myxococcales bacterium]|nr:TetR/AcrR family transcriptional regulator [Myxococcales bacterium]MCB9732419.1 TetR/AcrR family transcriptional regulator [Deltaproteobacteria bacterium]
MGRPPNGDPAATRRRILESAIEHFGRQGEEGAALRQIASDADVSMSTVMHHFGDKRGLFEACLDATYERVVALRQRFGEALVGVVSPREAIGPIVRTALAFGFENQPFVRVVATAAVSSGHFPGHLIERLAEQSLDRLGTLIASMLGRSVGDVRLMAVTFNHIVSRFTLTAPEELAGLVGVDGDGTNGAGGVDPRITGALEDQLTRLLAALIGVEPVAA